MKRAFWFDESYTDQQMVDAMRTKKIHAVHFMKRYKNRSVTENGAMGYRTTGKALLDLNFKVSYLRDSDEEYIVEEFIKAYHESPKYVVKWLFYLRDILEGLGERRTFRICLKYLAKSHFDIAKAVLPYIPQYGRYDDALVLLETELAGNVASMYRRQLAQDLKDMEQHRPVSLLAKWLPSINTSSAQTRKYAGILCRYFQMSPKVYRQTLSKLRAYSNVVESKMSASNWSEIDYETVPAKANMIYDKAFEKHDIYRRYLYLIKVFMGDGKLNTNGLMPYEIVHRLTKNGFYGGLREDNLAEMLWKKIIEDGFKNEWGFEDAIVVADGSGSMYAKASGSSSVLAIEICNSLAIYFAERNVGAYNNLFMTFSGTPEIVILKGKTLERKIYNARRANWGMNTDLKAAFYKVLEIALKNNISQEEMPKSIIVISDMEIDCCGNEDWSFYDNMANKFNESGYDIPNIIFWNVNSRNNVFHADADRKGVQICSGQSTTVFKQLIDCIGFTPVEMMKKVLCSERYENISIIGEG